MVKYKCGHEIIAIIFNTTSITLSEYFAWAGTVGIDGDRSLCPTCYMEKLKKEKIKQVGGD